MVDKDENGYIDKRELERALQAAGQNPTPAQVEEKFNAMDCIGQCI